MRDLDDVLLADLRRIAATVDPPPPLTVHPTHEPEPHGTNLVQDCIACVVCCLIVAGTRGVLPAGVRPCKGSGRIELRGIR